MNSNKTADAPVRLASIDSLRGLVIVLMALDHSRDFFGDLRIYTEDPATTPLGFFFTRWVTHFCAPTFVFLAGLSAWMYGNKVDNKGELSWFLFSRGAWLVLLEFTVIYFGVSFSFDVVPWMYLVIAAIGTSMIALSVLCYLPTKAVLMIGIIIICGHNLFDPLHADVFGNWGWLWSLLHDGPAYIEEANLEIGYPVLAWIGVMAAGYGTGPLMSFTSHRRRRVLLLVGLIICACFLVIRGVNSYGDPRPWEWVNSGGGSASVTEHGDASSSHSGPPDRLRTGLSFIRTTKYPPSLAFLLMTLGPVCIGLSVLETIDAKHSLLRILQVYGRVPLFFYVIHFYLLHLSSVVTYWIVRGEPISAFQAVYVQLQGEPVPESYGFAGLLQIYVAWIAVLLVTYPLCRWFGRLKRNGRSAIWSYL